MFEIPEGTQALIFDCDGTLADTMPLHYEAWQATMAEFGGELPEDLFYAWAGVPARDIIQMLGKRLGKEWPVEEVRRRKMEHAMSRMELARPIEPVAAVAREYHGRLPMAVASGGTRLVVHAVLKAAGLEGLFAEVVTADDVARGKPAPDIFLETARRLGVEPAGCLVFEDGEPGIEAARAAGMPVVDVRPALKAAL